MCSRSVGYVPVIDVRDGGPPEQAKRRRNQALALRAACLGLIPFGLGEICAWLGDPLVRRWLRRSGSPFLDEIETIARTLARPGIWFLHGAYVFGCTALADESPQGPILRRTLDWPFAGLGKLGVLVAVAASMFPMDKLEEMVNIGTLFAFVLVSAGVIVLRRSRPDLDRGFRVPGVPWLPIAAIAACLWLMLNLTALTWVRFLIWMGIGVVVGSTFTLSAA